MLKCQVFDFFQSFPRYFLVNKLLSRIILILEDLLLLFTLKTIVFESLPLKIPLIIRFAFPLTPVIFTSIPVGFAGGSKSLSSLFNPITTVRVEIFPQILSRYLGRTACCFALLLSF